jgi:hypothetical protein
MTVYEKHAYIYGYKIDGPATCYYLPTPRSRKWRRAWSVKQYSEQAYAQAEKFLVSGTWHAFKFEGGM